MTALVLLAVDGNSLLHRAYHAHERSGQRTADGRPCWGLQGLWSQLLAAINRLDPAAVLVAFDDAGSNDRKVAHPSYKAHRLTKHVDLRAQLDMAPDHFARAGLTVVQAPGAEADDVLASAAAAAEAAAWRCVLMTSDRDAFALISEATSVLRILNGGVAASPMLTPARLGILAGIRPEQYADYAALRGDTSDNLPGVPGIGPKTAVRLLSAFPSVAAAWAEIDGGGGAVAAAIGAAAARRLGEPAAREAFATNRELITMRTDLPLPALDDMRIPIAAGDLLAELDEWGMDSIRAQARWLLTAETPTAAVPTVRPAPRSDQLSLWDLP